MIPCAISKPPTDLSVKKKVSLTDINLFCDWLESLVDTVTKSKATLFAIFDLPSQIERKLKKNVNELLILQTEARATATLLQQLKTQRTAILKEITKTKDDIAALNNEEDEEISKVVSMTWPELNESWKNTKNSKNLKEVLKFNAELQERSEGLTMLQDAVQRRATKLTQKGLKVKRKPVKKKLPQIAYTEEENIETKENISAVPT